jgi:hypothetical protein
MSADHQPLPELAVSYRVRRRLKAQGKNLGHSARNGQFGRWFVVDMTTNEVLQRDVDLAELALELGAIRPSDTVAPPL